MFRKKKKNRINKLKWYTYQLGNSYLIILAILIVINKPSIQGL